MCHGLGQFGSESFRRTGVRAAEFHAEWKIPVIRVGSFDEILDSVAGMRSATRLRIVSHASSGLVELPLFRDFDTPSLDTVEYATAVGPAVELTPDRVLSALAKNEVTLVETL